MSLSKELAKGPGKGASPRARERGLSFGLSQRLVRRPAKGACHATRQKGLPKGLPKGPVKGACQMGLSNGPVKGPPQGPFGPPACAAYVTPATCSSCAACTTCTACSTCTGCATCTTKLQGPLHKQSKYIPSRLHVFCSLILFMLCVHCESSYLSPCGTKIYNLHCVKKAISYGHYGIPYHK